MPKRAKISQEDLKDYQTLNAKGELVGLLDLTLDELRIELAHCYDQIDDALEVLYEVNKIDKLYTRLHRFMK